MLRLSVREGRRIRIRENEGRDQKNVSVTVRLSSIQGMHIESFESGLAEILRAATELISEARLTTSGQDRASHTNGSRSSRWI